MKAKQPDPEPKNELKDGIYLETGSAGCTFLIALAMICITVIIVTMCVTE